MLFNSSFTRLLLAALVSCDASESAVSYRLTTVFVVTRLTVKGLILPVVYFLTPYCVLFATHQNRIIALMCVMFLKAAAVIVAFPSTTILLTNSCVSLNVLGTLNGYATTFSGIGRAIGPASTGAVFTWGAENGYIITAWFYLMFSAIVGAVPAFMIIEGEGPSTSVDNSDAEDDDAEDDESTASSTLLLPDDSAVASDSDDEDRQSSTQQSYGTISSRRA